MMEPKKLHIQTPDKLHLPCVLREQFVYRDERRQSTLTSVIQPTVRWKYLEHLHLFWW